MTYEEGGRGSSWSIGNGPSSTENVCKQLEDSNPLRGGVLCLRLWTMIPTVTVREDNGRRERRFRSCGPNPKGSVSVDTG